jgi:hypothetical protein
MRTLSLFSLSLIAVLLGGISVALAAPQFSEPREFNLEDIYGNAQEIQSIFENTAIYGKLQNPAAVYSFKPDRTGEQTISLIGQGAGATASPMLVLVDPTDNTESRPLGIPLPDDKYHTALINPIDGLRTFSEPLLFEQFVMYAEQRVILDEGQQYYLIVFDPSPTPLQRYAIRFGEEKVWTIGGVFSNFGSWLRFKTDRYGGTDPFGVTPSTFGIVLFYLAFAVLVGIWIIEEVFTYLAARQKMAGYILIKMQKFSRIIIWVGLWFMALGGYIYFDYLGWLGVPFVLGALFFLVAAVFLCRTLLISPRLMNLEVSKQEAVIPAPLQKQLVIVSILSVLVIGAFVVLLAMQFS